MENTPIEDGAITPKKNVLFEVTTVSRTLAAILFIILPFIGGWIGYKYAPEKIQEREIIVIQDIDDTKKTGLDQAKFDYVGWQDFYHKIYKISLKYPPDTRIEGTDSFTDEGNDSSIGAVVLSGDESIFYIRPVSEPLPLDYPQRELNPRATTLTPGEVRKWNIKDVAEEIRKMNLNDKNPNLLKISVSEMKEIEIDGQKAYYFTATGGCVDWQEDSLVNEPTTFLFGEDKNGFRFMISFPIDNEYSKLILESLKFN